MRRFALLVLVTLATPAACHSRPPLVALEAGPPLRLVVAPGVRINARLKPALELDDGTVLRFDSPLVTPDSAYLDRKSTRLNSSHLVISYAVFCLKKKKNKLQTPTAF